MIYKLNAIPIKILELFEDIDKLILKCLWKGKENWRAKTILKKKNKVEIITVSILETYYMANIIKTVYHWQMNKHINQQKRVQKQIHINMIKLTSD